MNVPIFRSSVMSGGTIDAVVHACEQVLRSGAYVLGANVASLELALSRSLDGREVVALNSGSDALKIALQSLAVGSAGGGSADDEVILPSYTFAACMEAVLAAGAVPVLVDSAPDGFAPDLEAWRRARSERTRAAMGVGLFGDPSGLAALASWCRGESIYFIEDIAQCYGATDRGQPAGTWGDVATMSFYPTKTLGAAGDAGACAWKNPAHAHRARLLRNHGFDGQRHIAFGHNSRMDELQAAVLKVMLDRLPEALERRRYIARRYLQAFAGIGLELPGDLPGHAWNNFIVLANSSSQRAQLAQDLSVQGVATRIYYPDPLHRQAPFVERFGTRPLPHCEGLADRSLALPLYPALTQEDVAHVIQSVQMSCRNF